MIARKPPRNEEAPSVAAPRASKSDQTLTKGTDTMDSSTAITTVPFHGHSLFLVDYDGQPYTPMKTIVEGMGLKWQPQHRKLNESRFKSCITEMVIQLPGDDQRRSVTCFPLRKLPGWLMTISPNKIKDADTKARVIQYQNDCDDALWAYWSEGVAINPRIGLTPKHQRELQKAIAGRVYTEVPEPRRQSAFKRIYRHLKDRFDVAKYDQIDDSRYTEALGAVQSFELEGDWLEADREPGAATFTDEDLSDLYILLCHVYHFHAKWKGSRIEEAMRILESPVAARMCEHLDMAQTFTNRLARAKGELMEVSRRRLGVNYGLLPIH